MANRIIYDDVMFWSRYIEPAKKSEDWHRRSDAAKKGWETRRLKKYLKSKEI